MRRIGGFMLALLSTPAVATNGYYAHGYGAVHKAMGGVGTAAAQTAMALAVNPAGLVNAGTRWDFGMELFMPQRGYIVEGDPTVPEGEQGSELFPLVPRDLTDTGRPIVSQGPVFPLTPGSYRSESTAFVIPHLARAWALGERWHAGVAMYGNGGMNTDYPAGEEGGVYRGGDTGVDLAQLFIAPGLAWQPLSGFSVGGALLLAYQQFRGEGFGSFAAFSSRPQKLSNHGYDLSSGAGYRVGAQASVGPLHLGAAYSSRIKMQHFDQYSGLFADAGGFDIPASLNLGAALHAGPLELGVELTRTAFSSVRSVGNPFRPNIDEADLGEPDGAGFGWQDMETWKFGLQWRLSERLSLRAGFNRGPQPIPSSEVLFNIVAPGVVERHYTAGFGWTRANGHQLSVAAMHAPEVRVSGPNPLDEGQTITIHMHQSSVEFSYGLPF